MDHLIQTITIYLLPVIFAITLHQAAYGYAAHYLGDNSAAEAGRLSLNPLNHFDLVGTLIVPVAVLSASMLIGATPLMFGWAKQMPMDYSKLRHPKRDMMWVSLAGPVANLLMAFAWALLYKLQLLAGATEQFFLIMALAGIQLNIFYMLFSLLPIPPLDGGRIVLSLLPPSLAWQYARIAPFGFIIVLVLIQTSVLTRIIMPFYDFFLGLIQLLFALN